MPQNFNTMITAKNLKNKGRQVSQRKHRQDAQ